MKWDAAAPGDAGMKRAWVVLAATVVVLTGPFADAQDLASRLFLAADRDRDGVLTRAELQATLAAWALEWDSAGKGTLTLEQLQEDWSAHCRACRRTRPRSPRTCRPCWPRFLTRRP